MVETIQGRLKLFRECIVCKQTRRADDFNIYAYTTSQAKRSQRLSSKCKECCSKLRKERHKRNRDRELARMKDWWANNRDRFRLTAQVEEKQCFRCEQIKPASEFYQNKRSADGLRSDCKDCKKAEVIEWRKRNVEKKRSYQRNWELRTKYGLTKADFLRMIEAQQGVCAICDVKPERFCVDHCHATGRVRKLLCFRCNTILGKLDDNPALAYKMADYLEQHCNTRVFL